MVVLLWPDDTPRLHNAQPAHGLACSEPVVLHHVEHDERAIAVQAHLAEPGRA